MIHLNIIFYFLICIWNNEPLAYSQAGNHDEIVSFIKQSNGLIGDSQTEDLISYSLFKELKRDGLLNTKSITVSYTSLIKKGKRESKSRPYDFIIERWIIEKGKSLKETHEILSDAIYDTFYEKPPKVVLTKGNVIYIISTWGAIYRDDLYKIRQELTQKYDMGFL